MAKASNSMSRPAKRTEKSAPQSTATSPKVPAGAVARGRPKRTVPSSDESELAVAAAREPKRRKIIPGQSEVSGSDPGLSKVVDPDPGHSKDSFPDANISALPDKVLRIIFSYLLEIDLCRLAQTCSRFNILTNDDGLWKRLYKQVYEYDLPLAIGTNPMEVYFIQNDQLSAATSKKSKNSKVGTSNKSTDVFPGLQLEPWTVERPSVRKAISKSSKKKGASVPGPTSSSSSTSSGLLPAPNPWKASFGHLYHAIHVYGEYKPRAKRSGRNIKRSACISSAYEMCDAERNEADGKDPPLILIHPGKYGDEMKIIESPTILLGCGPGPNPAEAVKIELYCEETYVALHSSSYLGYVTMRFNYSSHSYGGTDSGQYPISIEGASPIIDHCIVQSSAPDGGGLEVHYSAPIVRFCLISNCENVGISINGDAEGLYEDNVITGCKNAGIKVARNAKPILRRNKVLYCRVSGPLVFDEKLGYHRMR